jgi:hypothetical protein
MKLFGYSISLNVVILLSIFYVILVVNALSGSCIREGLGDMNPGDLVKELIKAEGNAFMKRRPLKESTKQGLINDYRSLRAKADTDKAYKLIDKLIENLGGVPNDASDDKVLDNYDLATA